MSFLSKIQGFFDTSESDYSLTLTEEELVLSSPTDAEKRIAWADLEEVSVYMTQPYSVVMPCIFWHLKGRKSDLYFPDRAGGIKEVLHIIFNLAGFNSFLYSEIAAGRYSEPMVVWKRSEKGD